jgi:SAM-dependent methyltransferase
VSVVARLPSSFNRPDERDAEAYEALVRQAVEEGGSLAALYPPRSRADEILDRLDIAAGDEVLDIGAGTGGLEIALLERGVAFEKLYAVDIDASALDLLDTVLEISRLEGADRVETLVSQPDDIRLPAGSVDVAIALNAPPIFLSQRGPGDGVERTQACLRTIHAALRDGGRLHVINRDGDLPPGEDGDICGRIEAVYSPLGFRVEERETFKVPPGNKVTPTHCWVRFIKE